MKGHTLVNVFSSANAVFLLLLNITKDVGGWGTAVPVGNLLSLLSHYIKKREREIMG